MSDFQKGDKVMVTHRDTYSFTSKDYERVEV